MKEKRDLFLCGRRAADEIASFSRFSLSYLASRDFMSLVNLSPPIFVSFNVNTKSAGTEQDLTRAPRQPGDGSSPLPTFRVSVLGLCLSPTWHKSLGSFLRRAWLFCCKGWTWGLVLSRADLTLRSTSVVSRSGQTDATVSPLRSAASG